jgi:hypothetical protein
MSSRRCAQRRDGDVDDRRAGRTGPGGSVLLRTSAARLAVGRGDDADVDRQLASSRPGGSCGPPARAAAWSACASGSSADLVEEQRAALGVVEAVRGAASPAPVKAPLTWPNSSDSISSALMAPQLTGTKGRCGARAHPRAARAPPPPCRRRTRPAAAPCWAWRRRGAPSVAQPLIACRVSRPCPRCLPAPAPASSRRSTKFSRSRPARSKQRLDGVEDLVDAEGLEDEVRGAGAQGIDGGFDVGEGGDQDHVALL